jgi:hypothetical protein
MPQATWIILNHVRKALVALYGKAWARGISTHHVGEGERWLSAINMWENRDRVRVCQHSLGRRMGTGDTSTYLAEWLRQGISALCGRMGAKDISTHYVGGCRQGILALTRWRMEPWNISSHLAGGYELAISAITMWEDAAGDISTL